MIDQLPEFPVLRRHLSAAAIAPGDVFVMSEDRAWLWQSRALRRLIAELDGTRALADLFDAVSPEVTPPEVVFLLHELHRAGLLANGGCETTPQAPAFDAAWWHALGVDTPEAIERVRGAPVRLRSAVPGLDTHDLADRLRAAGAVLADGCAPALEVVVVDHYFRPELAQINEAALASGSPWMIAKLRGTTLWLGPVLRPGATGCLRCLQDRLRLNRPVEDFAVRKTGDLSLYETSLGVLPTASRLATAWAAQEIALWLAGCTDRLEGKILTLDVGRHGLEVATHVLRRRPQCPGCGVAARAAVPVALESRPIVASSDGGYRVERPEATLRRLASHLSPITGVVTWLTSTFDDEEGLIHCYSSGHNFALGPDTPRWLGQSLRSRTGGKGTSATQARVSAVCEAIERYCGVFRDDVPRIRATYQALGDDAVPPAACLQFSEQQYQHREQYNADDREGFFHLIPRRFPEDLPIDWVAGWSLSDARVRYLPAALCYYGHPDIEQHFYCTGDANGCAAGTVVEEAVLQAFLELVERDAAAIWWYNRLRRPAVDLDAIADPYIDRLRDRYRRLDRDLWVLDLTADLQVPVYAAISRRCSTAAEDVLIGLGAHLEPQLALRRALTELNQFLPAVSRRGADGATIYAWPDDAAVRFWKTATVAAQPYLAPDPGSAPRRLPAGPEHTDLLDAVRSCLRIAQAAGLEVIALDQSRPDIDLKVVRVVVPGLRHFWRRLAPGRLYDVPVELGWLSEPTAEADLNPLSVFF